MLYLRKRGGFVKLALETGAHLLPVFSFVGAGGVRRRPRRRRRQASPPHKMGMWWGRQNENNTYNILGVNSPALDKFKRKFQAVFGISLPLITNLIPRKASVTVVVGAPIAVPKIEDPTPEQVQQYLDIYIAALAKVRCRLG